MRKLSRRLRVERLESRLLFAAAELGDQPTNVASVSLQDAASIDVSEAKGLRGAALEISFDHQRLQVDPRDVRAGSAWGGQGMSIANVDNDEGTISIFVFSARETELQHGSLVEIDFHRNDSDNDRVPPLIDINRLRLNDNEIIFADSDPASSTSNQNGSDGLPKLSLQFKIAPEGESSLVADRPDASAVDVLAKNGGATKPEGIPRNYEPAISPTVFEDLGLHPGDVCKPLEIASEHVDLAIEQWSSIGDKLKGPFRPAVAQDLALYASWFESTVDAMEVEPLRSIGIQKVELRTNGLPGFSVFPTVAIRRGVDSQSGHNPEATARNSEQPLDNLLSNLPFPIGLARLAIRHLPNAGMYK